MTIAELGAIGEFVGSIAVLATLIYLATQIRQNTRSMEDNKKFAMAQAYQARTDMWIQVTGLADQEVLSRVSDRNFDENSFGVFDPEKIKELSPVDAQRPREPEWHLNDAGKVLDIARQEAWVDRGEDSEVVIPESIRLLVESISRQMAEDPGLQQRYAEG